jgi:dTMP kinase
VTFVVVEGGEGVGKSTQVARLASALRADGRDVVVTHEPGDTKLGLELRTALLHADAELDPRAELLLLLADRAQHVAEVVKPALERGAVVVSDRYTPSSLAYQGIARGIGVDAVEQLSAWAAEGVTPDLVIVLDLPDEVAEDRVAAERDRFERAGGAFHGQVREAYRRLASERDWALVDASGTPEAVAERVLAAVASHIS